MPRKKKPSRSTTAPTVTVIMTPFQYEKLKRIAEAEDRSMGAVLRRMLDAREEEASPKPSEVA